MLSGVCRLIFWRRSKLAFASCGPNIPIHRGWFDFFNDDIKV